MTTTIYVLRLTGGKYYVGKSEDPMRRYEEHLKGKGSSWTRKYKPIGVEKIIHNASPFDEDKVTKEMMAKYGIDCVRGGSYVMEELDEIQEEAIRREIWGAEDRCTLCGRKGHFVKDCYSNTDVSGNKLEVEDSIDVDEWGCEYCNRTFSTEFGCMIHEQTCRGRQKQITKKYEQPVPIIQKQITKKQNCFRCGRLGHFANDCYAGTHVRGGYLDSDSDGSDW